MRKPLSRNRWLLPWAAAVLAAFAAYATAAAQSEQVRKLEITTRPIASFDNREPARTRFGSLDFRGGLELTSTERRFGGLSALRIAPDGGDFLSLTDHADWVRGRIVYSDGRPSRIEAAEIAPMLDTDGKPLAANKRADTESLAELGGKYCVGIERVNQVLCYDYRKQGLRARGEPIAVPEVISKLPHNRGLEAMVGIPAGQELAGTLIAIAEDAPDANGNHTAVMIGGPRPGQFGIVRSGDYAITDSALLPNGDLLLLERHFSLVRGVSIRIRRLAQSNIKPGAVVDGNVLIEADLGYQIDNMEGIAVHRAANGDTILTLVSDDNFSAIQRTLLLQFALVQ
jgi:hypothetical protein